MCFDARALVENPSNVGVELRRRVSVTNLGDESRTGRRQLQRSVGRSARALVLLDEGLDELRDEILLAPGESDGLLEDAL